jgi:hypothetical protein
MCLIIDKPEGTSVPELWLHNAVLNNDDGWGVMWAEGGKVRVEKGFREKGLKKWAGRLTEQHALIHCRLSTSGKKSVENCHPYPAGNGVWMMHNGIISIPSQNEDWSDTKHFVEYCVKPMLAKYPGMYGTPLFEGLLSYFVGNGNKLAFMNGKGEVQIVNKKQGVEKEGMWLSNSFGIMAPSKLFYGAGDYTRSHGYYGDEDLAIPGHERHDGWQENWAGRGQRQLPASTSNIMQLYVTHLCAMCKATTTAVEDDWEYLVGVGYICPVCYPGLENELTKPEDLTLYDLSQLPMEALRGLVREQPDAIALIIGLECGVIMDYKDGSVSKSLTKEGK